MKRLISLLFLINILIGYAQTKNEIYVYFDKEYPGKVMIDSIESEEVTYFIQREVPGEYIALEEINKEFKVVKKSFLRKINVIKISKLLSLDWEETVKVFENKKVYLIDFKQVKKKKVKIRELNVRTGISYEM